MKLEVQQFWLPKAGNTIEEFEDGFSFDLRKLRFAVADGATESSFAKQWAKLLAEDFVQTTSCLPWNLEYLRRWLKPLQEQWYEAINWECLPWFAEIKAKKGAFSTLTALQLFSPRSNTQKQVRYWVAFAIGDSCLFHIRKGQLLKSFPMKRAGDFNNTPWLLSSNLRSNQRLWDKKFGDCYETCDDNWQVGDFFLLATDALAHWCLKQYESGEKPWVVLQNLKTQEEFGSLVDQLRQDCQLRNDDTTLLRITIVTA